MKILQSIGKVLMGSSYEAANPSIRRSRVPGAAPSDARRELTAHTRRELVRKSRYLNKNSGFSREVVGDMAIYSTGDGIRPQAQTADPAWNRQAEEFFKRWSARPEVTNRFSFEECQNLVCRGIDVDGEYFVLKIRDKFGRARIQLVESHRIGSASEDRKVIDGIEFDAIGAPFAYHLIQDNGKPRKVFANAVMHVFEPEFASGARSHPTLQHSINHILDEMEMLALEKHAVKDNQDVSRIIKRESGTLEDDGDFRVSPDTGEAADQSDPSAIQRITGGKVLALKPGESMDSFQSNRPSSMFTGFLEHLKRDSSAGVLPYEFVLDSSSVGGAGVRLIVAKADRRFSYRQLILIQRFLKPTWGWVIGDAIDRGELEPMKGWNKVTWVTPRRITVDAGREAESHRKDVEMGLLTFSDHFSEIGMDFREEIERRAQDSRDILDMANRYGVPVDMLYRPSGTKSTPAQEPLTSDGGSAPQRSEEES
ncbi:MAG: phage portal protein [Puniceicoccaceae bacterium]